MVNMRDRYNGKLDISLSLTRMTALHLLSMDEPSYKCTFCLQKTEDGPYFSHFKQKINFFPYLKLWKNRHSRI